MPYSIPWEESEPVGAITPAETIDTEIQELKISIRERMNDLIGAGNWEDDNVDPKVIALSSVLTSVANESFVADGSTNPALTEVLNTSGGFTVAGTEITIDVGGTFLVFVTSTIVVSNPDGGERGQLQLQGTASINFPIAQATVYPSVFGGRQTITGIGSIEANDGETVELLVTADNVQSQSVLFSSGRIILVKVA